MQPVCWLLVAVWIWPLNYVFSSLSLKNRVDCNRVRRGWGRGHFLGLREASLSNLSFLWSLWKVCGGGYHPVVSKPILVVSLWLRSRLINLNQTYTLKRSSSSKSCLQSNVIFHQRSSSFKGCLPSKVVFHQRSSSIKVHLTSKPVFCQRLSFVRGHLPSKVVFF